MVLATYGDHLWTATLYYASDNDLNIYFLSNPSTIHCQHIESNSEVAIAICDSPQDPSAKKVGLQAYGLAKQISGKTDVIQALELWKQSLNVTSDSYTYENMMNDTIKGRMYKISLKKVKFFNQNLWEEGEEPVLEL